MTLQTLRLFRMQYKPDTLMALFGEGDTRPAPPEVDGKRRARAMIGRIVTGRHLARKFYRRDGVSAWQSVHALAAKFEEVTQ